MALSEEQMEAIMHDPTTCSITKLDRLLSLVGICDELGTLAERCALLVRDYDLLREIHEEH